MALIGIDLGTTNSLVAVFENGSPRLIKNSEGETLTPSVVHVDGKGTVLVGQAARERLVSHPTESAAAFKRLMGTKVTTKLGSQSFLPEDLSALVLRNLKRDAEADLGCAVTSAVISVPAYFNDQQRKSTIAAAKLAGLDVTRLVNEPTAAALAYGLNEKTDGTFIIFDLGGGTFDVSILDKYDGVMEIKSTTGDTKLGGEDFTLVLEDLISKATKLAPAARKAVAAALRRQAEIAKRELTSQHEAQYRLIVSGEAVTGSVSRTAFERECGELLKRLRIPTERAIRDAGLDLSTIEAVVMVGGATRMPMVRSIVAKMFGKIPMAFADPDTTVALGAAVQAGLVARDAAVNDIVMTDVCPFTLGTAAVEDADSKDSRLVVVPIIERNAVIPISRSSAFFTIANRQKAMNIEVYQGENLRPDANVYLGQINVSVPSNKKGEEGVDVRFTYDVNGVLQVEATVISTKQVYKKIFNNTSGLAEDELEKRFQALNRLKLAPREDADNKAIVARAERLYEESLGRERDELRALLAAFEHEIQDQKLRNPEKIRAHYTLLLDAFEKHGGPLG